MGANYKWLLQAFFDYRLLYSILEQFSYNCRRTNSTKVITPTNHNRSKQRDSNQLEFLAITCNFLKVRKQSRKQDAIGFSFASLWLKNWREFLKRITKRGHHHRVITFDSHQLEYLLNDVVMCDNFEDVARFDTCLYFNECHEMLTLFAFHFQ